METLEGCTTHVNMLIACFLLKFCKPYLIRLAKVYLRLGSNSLAAQQVLLDKKYQMGSTSTVKLNALSSLKSVNF
jgi:hypothetical protein